MRAFREMVAAGLTRRPRKVGIYRSTATFAVKNTFLCPKESSDVCKTRLRP
jgi:hypothetical protein